MGLNITFSGCGFLGVYHIGVVSCLKFYGRKLLDEVDFFGGSSAGALAACTLLCDIDLEEGVQFVMHTAAKVHGNVLGPLSPSFDPSAKIRKTFMTYLPANAYKIATGKLKVSLTRVSDWSNVVVSEFKSNKELVDALVCSSFLPFFSGVTPPKFKGVHYIDGGFTDNLPQQFGGTTITVSPFSGESDICPNDGHRTNAQFDLRNTSVQITGHNIYRLARALFPSDTETLAQMCRHGFEDTLKYLNHHYPDKLSIDVDIVSIPQCCHDEEVQESSEEGSICSCGGTSTSSYFSDMENLIARNMAIHSLVVPEKLNIILQKATNIIHESDLYTCVFNILTNVTKWLLQPHYYLSHHIHDFLQEIFKWLLPRVKEISSQNAYTEKLLRMAMEMYDAYHGTSTFEWHPSLNEEKFTNIAKRNHRIRTATKSLVAFPKSSVSSLYDNIQRKGHEAPPPSRQNSFVRNSSSVFINFDMFASEPSSDNDNEKDECFNDDGGLVMKRRSRSILAEHDELLYKDDDGLILDNSVTSCSCCNVDYLSCTSNPDDYGSDLCLSLDASDYVIVDQCSDENVY